VAHCHSKAGKQYEELNNTNGDEKRKKGESAIFKRGEAEKETK
jgi:hypothetical protein